jgi:predicted nucleic-acid-binding protein
MKVGLDTNLLVQYVTQDDPRQAKVVDAFLDEALAEGTTLRVSCIVLCELAWVLQSLYGYPKHELERTLDALVAVQQLEIEERDLVILALEDYRRGGAEFSDYLIGRKNQATGCDHTVTFDRKLKAAPTFKVLR